MHTSLKPRALAAAIAAALIVLPLAVIAQSANTESCAKQLQAGACINMPGPHDGQPWPPRQRPMPGLAGLDLSDAQQAKISALGEQQQAKIQPLLEQADAARQALQALARSANFAQDKAQVLAQTHANALSQVALLHAELDAKIHTLLTPEQQHEFAQASPCKPPLARE